MIELMQTDFPDPVAPAISRCGISRRSATILFPEMSFPTTNSMMDEASMNSSLSMRSRMSTGAGFSFSTSIPTAALPGIGASIRMLLALMLSAISSESLVMLATFTPVAGCTSYLVTEAPCVTLMTLASTPKFLSVLSRSSARSCS